MSDVFISYSRTDRKFVHRLVADLDASGVSVFFDQRIVPGDSWAESIAKAIDDAKHFLLVLSPDYIESAWAQEEMKLGLLREAEGRTKVIPLMVRKCEPPEFIKNKAYANFLEDYNLGLSQLIPALKGTTETAKSKLEPESESSAAGPLHPDQFISNLEEAVAAFLERPETALIDRQAPSSSTDHKKCFVVMPFSDPELQIVYEDVVRPVIEGQQLICERGDDAFGSNVIMEDIRTSIEKAQLLIADLTGRNPNVFYEVGIAHAINKPVLLLAQSTEDVPFDLRHRRVLIYEYSFRGAKRLEKALKQNLSTMLKSFDQ